MRDVPDRLATALADRYRLERELGQGGMATVYLADDLRHHRKVALKILRPELAAVIGAARFLHEIRTTANLQHPHILPLHDSGEVDGTVFYVMPYVEGESLRDRLDREKQLPVEDAIHIAVEVAGALEYAHRHQVIHRDIKPENILLQGGHALVADFGIALAAARTDGATRMTETGMSLGTPHYMSPEQAMGEREITTRSDVYALGCVLYETLTGEPPFTGPTAQAIVARVMTEEPRSLTVQRRTVPRHVEAAVHRALSKLPADRYASAAAFADALVNPAAFTGTVAAGTAHPSARPSVRLSLLGGLVVIAAAVAAFVAGRTSAPEPPAALAQFMVALPDSITGIARCCGTAQALSPDGGTLVFVAGGGSLYRRALGRVHAEPIPGTDGAAVPFFSPDSRWIGFFLDGRLRKAPLAGGPALPVVEVERGDEATWTDADQVVYVNGRALWIVPAAGGAPRAVTAPDSGTRHYAPFALPGGRRVLLTIRGLATPLEDALIGVADLESGRVDTIGPGTKAAYANGYLLFAGADHTLLAQPFDARRGRPSGPAVAILDKVGLHGGTTHEFTVSPSGGLAYQRDGENRSGDILYLSAPEGRTAIPLPGRRNVDLEDPAIGPGGRRIALTIIGAMDADIWIFDRQQGTLERFTVGGGRYPVWSADGQWIAFGSRDGLYMKRADGTGGDQLILSGAELRPGSWLPDGQSLVIHALRGTNPDIGIVSIGDTVPRWLVATEFAERHPQVSRDGRWLAYVSNRTGRQEVYVQPIAGEGPRVQVSTEGGQSPRWSPDGRTLYYVVGQSLLAATVEAGAEFRVLSRRTVLEAGLTDLNVGNVNWDIHPNGREFLYIDATGAAGLELIWVLNWTAMTRPLAGGSR